MQKHKESHKALFTKIDVFGTSQVLIASFILRYQQRQLDLVPLLFEVSLIWLKGVELT